MPSGSCLQDNDVVMYGHAVEDGALHFAMRQARASAVMSDTSPLHQAYYDLLPSVAQPIDGHGSSEDVNTGAWGGAAQACSNADWNACARQPSSLLQYATQAQQAQQADRYRRSTGDTWKHGNGSASHASFLDSTASDEALRRLVKSESVAERPATATCVMWSDARAVKPARPNAQAPAHYMWVDASGNASLTLSSASTWSDDPSRQDGRSDCDTRHPREWQLRASDQDHAWANAADLFSAVPDLHAPAQPGDDASLAPALDQAGHGMGEYQAYPCPTSAAAEASHAMPASSLGAEFINLAPFAAPTSDTRSFPNSLALELAAPRVVRSAASSPHRSTTQAAHVRGRSMNDAPAPWDSGAGIPGDDEFEDFCNVFLKDPHHTSLFNDPELTSLVNNRHGSPRSTALWPDVQSMQHRNPFADDAHLSEARAGAAAAVASAPHHRASNGRSDSRGRLAPRSRAASMHLHRNASHDEPDAVQLLTDPTFRRSCPLDVPSFGIHQRAFGGASDGGRTSKSAQLCDERAGTSVVIGGAAVMLTGQRQQLTVGSDDYIRMDNAVGDIIRVRRPPTGEARAPTLQDKVAAACLSGDTGTQSNGNADSTHGGSTNRKRKAAAAMEMKALGLESSHHSTGRGAARRKAHSGLSTTEHIKSVMGASEPPAIVDAILAWEAQQPRAGKWKGVNARQWGKVGIEIRLTGQSRHEGPVTAVGAQVARFADIVMTAAEVGSAQGRAAGRGSRAPAYSDGDKRSNNDTSSHSTGSPGRPAASSLSVDRAGTLKRSQKGNSASCDLSVYTKLNESCEQLQEAGKPHKLLWRNRGKDKAWLGTYHTPVNAAVHHDFFKVVLAVEGKIFTSRDMDACDLSAGRQRPHALKMNFPLDELPALMRQSVAFTNLWHKYYQGSERYIFRDHDPIEVEKMVADFIAQHCAQLREYIPLPPVQDCEGKQAQPRTQPRRASKVAARDTLRSFRSLEGGAGADDAPAPDTPEGDGEDFDMKDLMLSDDLLMD